MGNYAVIENNVVVNVIEADAVFAASINAVALPEGYGIGDSVEAGIFAKAALLPIAEEYKPLDPSALLMGLLHLNITPDMVDEAIASMPEADRTFAKWRWERSQTFMRDDWLIAEMAVTFGKTPEEVDEAWRYAQQ